MQQINFLQTRSFWAAAAALVTGLEQTVTAEGGVDIGVLAAVGALLEAAGLIQDSASFVSAVGQLITAAFGLWAYFERLKGKKQVVAGRAKK